MKQPQGLLHILEGMVSSDGVHLTTDDVASVMPLVEDWLENKADQSVTFSIIVNMLMDSRLEMDDFEILEAVLVPFVKLGFLV